MMEYTGKVLMLQESNFPGDPRPRNEADTLTKAGYKVTVIALREKGERAKEHVNGVCVYRVPKITLFRKIYQDKASFIQRLLNHVKSTVGYIFEYFYFTSVCLLLSLYIAFKEGLDVIHAHNPPDTLFIVGALLKPFGKKFVFDHHDLSPELYLTRFSRKKDFVYKILILCEKLSCKLADVIISTNESYKRIEMNRHHIDSKKIYVVRNNPILSECLLRKNDNNSIQKKNKKELLYLGSINPQDGLDFLLQALHYLVNDLNKKNFICYIVGDGDSLHLMKEIAKELDLMDYVDFKGFIYEREEIKKYLYLSDIGVEPASDNELNRHSTFIKIMEYMAAGKPIVAFDLKETRYSADESAILVSPGDIKGFAYAIKKLIDEPQLREELGKAGSEKIKQKLNWEKASLNLIEAYKSLSL